MLVVADDGGGQDLDARACDARKALDRRLKERLGAGNREKLLWKSGARERPEPRAATAGHDDRLY